MSGGVIETVELVMVEHLLGVLLLLPRLLQQEGRGTRSQLLLVYLFDLGRHYPLSLLLFVLVLQGGAVLADFGEVSLDVVLLQTVIEHTVLVLVMGGYAAVIGVG